MSSNIYKQLIFNRIKSFINDSDNSHLINHSGLNGEIKENILRNFISDFLPVDWGIGSGKIINSHNKISSETDLIIFYKKILPPIFFNEFKGIFPIESCGFVFEVKTMSTSTQIKTTINKFNKLKNLIQTEKFDDGVPEWNIKPIRIYFAYDTNLKTKDELSRYLEIEEDKNDPAIQIICIVGKGIWKFNKNKNKDYGPEWIFYPNQGNHEEIFILISILLGQMISLVTYNSINVIRYFFSLSEELKYRKIIDF